MAPITIMNWNIQNLNFKKTNLKEVPEAIGMIIATAAAPISRLPTPADIVLITELSDAGQLSLQKIATAANDFLKNNNIQGEYKYYCSPPLGYGEACGILVRTGTDLEITPLIWKKYSKSNPNEGTFDYPVIEMEQGEFCSRQPNEPYFPIVVDVPSPANVKSPKNFNRYPCLAMFKVKGGNNTTQLLPIVVWHLDVTTRVHSPALEQIKRCQDLEIACAYLSRGAKQIKVDGTLTPVSNLIITGDFNINFPPRSDSIDNWARNWDAYSSVTKDVPDEYVELGKLKLMAANKDHGTLLCKYENIPGRINNTRGLCQPTNFDNFFVGLCNEIQMGNTIVYDVPGQICVTRPPKANEIDGNAIFQVVIADDDKVYKPNYTLTQTLPPQIVAAKAELLNAQTAKRTNPKKLNPTVLDKAVTDAKKKLARLEDRLETAKDQLTKEIYWFPLKYYDDSQVKNIVLKDIEKQLLIARVISDHLPVVMQLTIH